MMQEYPRGLSYRPFAIRFAFTANHSLDECKTLLTQAEVTPRKGMRWLGAAYLEFKFPITDGDMWTFDAAQGPRSSMVVARGNLRRVDVNTTSVIGYSDARFSLYITLLQTIIGVLIILVFFDGTFDGLLASVVIGLIWLLSVFVNRALARRKAKALALTIEETLKR